MAQKYLVFFLLMNVAVSAQILSVHDSKKNGAHLMDDFISKPEYPGGYNELVRFLNKNIQYPQMERDLDIEGVVKVVFLVDEYGQVKDVEIIRGVTRGLNNEAIRVIKMLYRFKPALYYKKPVRVYYMLDVTFRVEK